MSTLIEFVGGFLAGFVIVSLVIFAAYLVARKALGDES